MATGMVRERLGQMIVRYRDHAGLTQRDLAARLDVSPGTVANWEAGDRWPDDRNLVALIEECSLNPSELFGTHPVYRSRRRAAGSE
jgi:transcriptional regulator with XRE-family HTH domain